MVIDSASSTGAAGDFAAHDSEIVGDNAPAEPTLEARFASMATVVQSEFAFEHTDASFNASVKTPPASEPGAP